MLKTFRLICLAGNLGSGKTTFTKEFGRQLGIKQIINSPTFIIQNEYQNEDIILYHLDLYRIENEHELAELKLINTLSDDRSITIIEWADKFRGNLNKLAAENNINQLWINFEHINENTRKIDTNI